MRLAGKVCVVTGGASGIGRATCLLFAEEGGKVVVADKSSDGAQSVACEAGDAAIALCADVSDSQSVRAMLKQTVDHFGRLDVLVNNAGYGIPGSVVETDEADWDRLMAVNLNGVFYGCKYAIPIMRRQGGGVIVNTASVVATVGIRKGSGAPPGNQNALKHGLYTKQAIEERKNLRQLIRDAESLIEEID